MPAIQMTIHKIVSLAKHLDVEELNRLSDITQFVEIVGRLIHKLQTERGASSIFLATDGSRFADVRQHAVSESASVEEELRAIIEGQIECTSFGRAKFLYLMAWVLTGLDQLPALRGRIARQETTTGDCMVAFSRLIASLVSLIFEIADSAVDPRTTRLLVALFNLVQGKEFAGQERVIGALSFSAGGCDTPRRNRLLHLIEAQAQHFQIFEEFASGPLLEKWREIVGAPASVQLQRMRRTLCDEGGKPDPGLSATWFDICSERLSAIWVLQRALVQSLRNQCAALAAEANGTLQDSEGLLKALCASPPAHAELASRLFDSALPMEAVLRFEFQAGSNILQGQSIMDVFHAQSRRLITMEADLAAARRALDDRKKIERAKGILMARFNLGEDDAYKRMRSASMEQNKRLVEIAEAILTTVALS